ncbi:MAG: hypothetical protein AVDCRST_MAG02-4810, partial [uncultured Rubrobacteraceae bacterium]
GGHQERWRDPPSRRRGRARGAGPGLAGADLQRLRRRAQHLVLGGGPGGRRRPDGGRGVGRLPGLPLGLPHRHPGQGAALHREHRDAGGRGAHRPEGRAEHAEDVGGGV